MEKIRIAEIDWKNAHHINNGEWCCVFDLGNDLVAKVGLYIKENEAEAQQYIYERHNKALPVLGHEEEVMLPAHVRTHYCPIHGPAASESRRKMLSEFLKDDLSWFGELCTCEMALDVMCMPKANPNISDYRDDGKIQQFIQTVNDICGNELRRWWDPAPRNVAHWRRHLVALDFTDLYYPCEPSPYPVKWKFRK